MQGCEPATGRCPEPIRKPGDQIQQSQETGQRIPAQVFIKICQCVIHNILQHYSKTTEVYLVR